MTITLSSSASSPSILVLFLRDQNYSSVKKVIAMIVGSCRVTMKATPQLFSDSITFVLIDEEQMAN